MNLLKSFVFLAILSSLTLSQTTYFWNGSVNSNFSTAGNWTPVRQVGLVNDILIFENSGNLNVINVNQVTIGQLFVINNTNLTLSPSTGNAKTITIKGCTGEDLVIESGSSLKISGNDPQLNIFLSANATASISGSLTFQGEIAHNINSADPLAIKFRFGSQFTQMCPGSIFNTTGVNNSAVFENGSVFKIDHINALNPFGVSAPNSKVMFEDESELVISRINSLQLSGRNISNLFVEPNVILNISESFNSDVTFESITVKTLAELNIVNTNENFIPSFNVRGNINVNGALKFTETAGNKFNVHMNGTLPQAISGTGEISIPRSLSSFTIENDIVFNRNLIISCLFKHLSGAFTLNIYSLIINGRNEQIIYNNPNKPYINPVQIAGTVENNVLPTKYSFSQNYPNPFNPATKIDYSLPEDLKVTIKIFDITGKESVTLINSEVEAGNHTISFNATNLSSGIYFYTITAGSFTKTMKMILSK